MDAFEQMYEIVTAFNDDGFKAKIKEVGEGQKALSAGKKDHATREAGLARREKEASVVLNSQETFNKQHADEMAALQVKRNTFQRNKDKLEAERKAFDIKVHDEEERLKAWTSDLGKDQKKVDAVLKNEQKTKKALENAENKEAEAMTRLERIKEAAG